MAYNKINKLLRCKKVIDIVQEHYIHGITTYAGIFRKFVYPIYPMSYNSFMEIINIKNVNIEIAKEIEKAKKQETVSEPKNEVLTNQLPLFERYEKPV